MRKYTVITKDGSKWLRQPGARKSDAIYLGIHPEGTVLDENEVQLKRQYQDVDTGQWFDIKDESPDLVKDLVRVYREAYTDAESHDRHISDDYPGIDYQPLFNHMSKNHGLTLTTSEMDEIIGLSTYILAEK